MKPSSFDVAATSRRAGKPLVAQVAIAACIASSVILPSDFIWTHFIFKPPRQSGGPWKCQRATGLSTRYPARATGMQTAKTGGKSTAHVFLPAANPSQSRADSFPPAAIPRERFPFRHSYMLSTYIFICLSAEDPKAIKAQEIFKPHFTPLDNHPSLLVWCRFR